MCREKHVDRYFVVDSDEELYATALKILRGRLKSTYYYFDPGPKPEPPDYPEEIVHNLPLSLRALAVKKLQEYKERTSEWEKESEFWGDVNLVCSEADGRRAWGLLRDRSNHEYERVFVEPADVAY